MVHRGFLYSFSSCGAPSQAVLEQALEMNPVHPRIHLMLIALCEQVERPVDAQWMVEQLLLLHPGVSLSRLHDAFPFKNHRHLEQLLDGLRKAGLPGLPG